MLAKEGKGASECRSSEEPGEIAATFVMIRAIYPSAKPISEKAERKRVARVQLHLQAWLPPVGSEAAFADDESHNVPDLEFVHGREDNDVFRPGTEPRGTAISPSKAPRGTSGLKKSPPSGGLLAYPDRRSQCPGTNCQRAETNTVTDCSPGFTGVGSAWASFPRCIAKSYIGRGGEVGPCVDISSN